MSKCSISDHEDVSRWSFDSAWRMSNLMTFCSDKAIDNEIFDLEIKDDYDFFHGIRPRRSGARFERHVRCGCHNCPDPVGDAVNRDRSRAGC
jgi:hypothetical protein